MKTSKWHIRSQYVLNVDRGQVFNTLVYQHQLQDLKFDALFNKYSQ